GPNAKPATGSSGAMATELVIPLGDSIDAMIEQWAAASPSSSKAASNVTMRLTQSTVSTLGTTIYRTPVATTARKSSAMRSDVAFTRIMHRHPAARSRSTDVG